MASGRGGRGASVKGSRLGHAGRVGGFLRRVEARAASPLRILTYHRVGAANGLPHMVVSPSNLSEHLAVLREHATVVALAHHLTRSRRTARGRRRYALTFDDGYADNLHVATPILEAHDAPATVFVCPGYLDRPYFWWDRLADIAEHERERFEHEAIEIGLVDGSLDDGSGGPRSDNISDRVARRLATLDLAEKEEILDELGGRVGFSPDPDAPRPLTTEELHALAVHPLITIGAHTRAHLRLPSVPLDVARRDVVEGARSLDDLVGPGQRPFAYPHGAVSRSVAKAVREAGHRHALTTVSRPVSILDGDLAIPRLATHDVAGEAFARQRGFTLSNA